MFHPASALAATPKTHSGAVKLYDDWAISYDSTLRAWGYNAHSKTTSLVAKFAKETGLTVKRILDCGCGTGMVGEEIVKQGIGKDGAVLVTGVDCSVKSLVVSSRKAMAFCSDREKQELVQPQLVSCDSAGGVHGTTFRSMNETATKADLVLPSGLIVDGKNMEEDLQALSYTPLVDSDNVGISADKAAAAGTKPIRPLYSQLLLGDLDKPFVFFKDSSLDAVMCVGTTSYVTEFQNVFGEWCRIVRKQGLVVFTEVTNLWDNDELCVRTVAKQFEDKGKWKLVHFSEQSAYMPKNPAPEEAAKQIYYIVYQVL